jgi:hypothetical protein
MCAVNIYHRAIIKWLGRFDAGVSTEDRQRRQERLERAERICRRLRAELMALDRLELMALDAERRTVLPNSTSDSVQVTFKSAKAIGA